MDLGGGCRGCAPPPPIFDITCSFLIQLVFCKKNFVVYWCRGKTLDKVEEFMNNFFYKHRKNDS